MKKILVANWKMNPQDSGEAGKLFSLEGNTKSREIEVVICPPFQLLFLGRKIKAKLGAQDVFWEESGAYTGEVSPIMLKKMGISYVIVGHSERRKYLAENDEMVNKKVLAAAKAGLKVILCVGEPLSIRKKGLSFAKRFVGDQLSRDLRGVRGSLIIAYEPIWAISRGRTDSVTDSPLDAQVMARYILFLSVVKKLERNKVKVIYGGSVTSKNIADFVQYNEISGALVGGASLKGEEFKKMVKITSQYAK